MGFSWIPERAAHWDDAKQRIVGGAPAGVFDRRYAELRAGDSIPCEWWRVEDDGQVVGFGWLDLVWGEAEILLATAPEARGRGVGSFILEHLEAEATARGINYIYNVVRPTHPDGPAVTAWLVARGFRASDDGSLFRNLREARPTRD